METPENQKVLRGLIALLLLTALFTSVIGWLQHQTAEQIELNQTERETRLIIDVLPADSYNNQPQADITLLRDTELIGSGEPLPVYRARQNNSPVAIAMTVVAPDGYVGPIKLLVGIDAEGRVVRARVTGHRETPGLGDRIEIEKSNWITQFDGKAAGTGKPWLLDKDGGELHSLTGATITSRAVSRAIRRSLMHYDANQTELFAPQD